MKIILASASLGRKKILTDLGLKFTVMPANIDERKITASNHITLVKKIARAKAMAICHSEQSEESHEILRLMPQDDTIIIAADSMVFFRGKTYGKPKDKKEAKAMLSMLSGQTHEFITGLCVLALKGDALQSYQRSCKTKVIFEKFNQKEIDDYVKVGPVTSCAGGYSIENTHGSILTKAGLEIIQNKIKLIGSKSNVIGLPLEILLPILKENGVKI